jgi:hypothetical protein
MRRTLVLRHRRFSRGCRRRDALMTRKRQYRLTHRPGAASGSDASAHHVVEALSGGRRGCLMANHGQIACGPDLDSAFSLAKDIEDLSRQYVMTLQIGGPKLLDDHEMGSRAQRVRRVWPADAALKLRTSSSRSYRQMPSASCLFAFDRFSPARAATQSFRAWLTYPRSHSMSQRLLAAICLLASAAAAQGSPRPQDISSRDDRADFRAACASSAMTACWAQAMSGDRAAVRACMIRNLPKLSPKCQVVVRAHMGDQAASH